MQLALEKSDFVRAIHVVKEVAATPGKTILPVLSNILIKANENGIQLEASDLTTSIKTKMNGMASGSGLISLPAKKLAEMARELPNKPITITTTDNFRAKIVCGRGSYTIIGEADTDFPKIVDVGEPRCSIKASELIGMINRTEFAAANDVARYWLNALYIQMFESNIEIAATSGPRLAVAKQQFSDTVVGNVDAIVPLKTTTEIKGIFEDSGEIDISTTDKQMIFTDGETILVTNTIGADYPNYRGVIPKNNNSIIIADREELLSVSKRVSLFSSSQTQSLKFEIKPAEIWISGRDANIGDAREPMDVETENVEPFDILLSSIYLMEALERIETDNVVMKFKDGKTGVILEPEEMDNHLCLIMPMQPKDEDGKK